MPRSLFFFLPLEPFLSLVLRVSLSSLVSPFFFFLSSFRMLLRATATAGSTTTDRLHPKDDEREELTIRQFKSTRFEPPLPVPLELDKHATILISRKA